VDPYNICGWRGLLDLLLEKRESPQDAERMIQHCAKVNPENPPVLNMLAWKVYKHRLELLYPQAEAWAQEAGRMMPDDAAYQHTIASILTFRQKVPEALKHAGNYLEMTDAVEKTISDAIDLFVMLAAKGAGAEALTILNNSPSAMILEPLIVGLRIFLGEDVKVAAEIKEVGEDVARRIREYTGT